MKQYLLTISRFATAIIFWVALGFLIISAYSFIRYGNIAALPILKLAAFVVLIGFVGIITSASFRKFILKTWLGDLARILMIPF